MPELRFIPLTKADEERREVWGFGAVEEPDVHGEIMDYDASKPNFVAWSNRVEAATGGKSKGNIRALHKGALAAVGKIIHFEPLDDKKAIFIGAKIVDDDAWNKVKEGVFTGFSVGGKYGRRWADSLINSLRRYEAMPEEFSLVDWPAAPSARFELVKMGGTSEQREFQKGASLDEFVTKVRSAWNLQFQSPPPADNEVPYSWVVDVQTDQVIVERGKDGLFAYPYTISTDMETIIFSEPAPVEKVYMLKKGMDGKMGDIMAQMEASDNPELKALAAKIKAAMMGGDGEESQAPAGAQESQPGQPESNQEGTPPAGAESTEENPPATPGGNQESQQAEADDGTVPPTAQAGAVPGGQGLSAESVREIVIELLVELGLAQRSEGGLAKAANPTDVLDVLLEKQIRLAGERWVEDGNNSIEALRKSFDGALEGVTTKQNQLLGDMVKIVTAVNELAPKVEGLEKRGAQGPILRVPVTNPEQQQIEILKKMASDTNDPLTRQTIQAEITRLSIKSVQS